MTAAKKTKRTRIILIVVTAAVLTLAAIMVGAYALGRSLRAKLYVPLTQEEIDAALARSPETDPDRLAVVESAVSLVGKVHYFWGGKSFAAGWDENWGVPTEVTASGSSTTGTVRPFGLDCSGFVTWAFLQTGMSRDEVMETVGNGTFNQFNDSMPIRWKDLRPGDLVFMNEPGRGDNHVGICIGFTENGKPLFCHCASGFDNVVVTPAGDVFRYARRPLPFYTN